MNIILFTHPSFMNSQSMPRFAGLLQQSFEQRGHEVAIWSPKPFVFKLFSKTKLAKWAGYIDQYILFPMWVRVKLLSQSRDTLFAFSDQALGPWIPLVRHRPHVVHAHDLLALRSALGLIPENPTSWSGQLYQKYIRSGFQRAKHFISVSNKTKHDLAEYGGVNPTTSEVVYNGLSYPFKPILAEQARQILLSSGLDAPASGILLHISGNQWYKNVVGVINIYAAYARKQVSPLPLWLIGVSKTAAILHALDSLPAGAKVEFFYKLTNEQIHAAYSVARAFIFPSHAEGFGWPIVEAQACGCPVVTTNDAPMNEIGGPQAKYLPKLATESDLTAWSESGAKIINELLTLTAAQEATAREARIAWALQFDAATATTRYLEIYERILQTELS